ncbi:bifunctional phosphopantothenoylcysteine decarboxylase/phosphopantothenate--cysteine ligase CoaBC [Mycoplasmopsis pullorum]|uniref:bifunctional phosphopantothenoylcysteine decarboxylase/phosphopantothenate--cysteine ligase CoaBC n=5 Tax=Mycoplasmopsis pullorum TaxID=48003 RepID=UPI0011185DCC|nr:bifunctional phosphopantothenoylcysteine decarboxylase/phosphopantothenate--cysteine ligase CoaBC [Mycoplasmopsis pullorum]TNK86402.1 bifunctional phosphopantothenoylcysteine decarboxylase/phosphopantothenate--cysteine ligase CoaBC [Mycoplasmopsis pullorum]TNK88113.1 bifunctional phosphopantothenoylcysteine decarboxylase/phosphopantothenate--cysteine ligase CoaBC [Mycoplasmopsis pullorum]TNK88288.1 bifunctional phosphopantothenoylcysteine decarboxylase/phosphopantothenate--cysteine ligase Coa
MNILILGTSSIAVKRINSLVSLLKKESNVNVKVVLSPKADQFDLVDTNDEFELVNYQSNYQNLDPLHVNLAKWADWIIIFPATFNTINKYANGISDNFILDILSLGFHNKTLICPAMNTLMYQNPILQNNIQKLKELGITFLGPIQGLLHCGDNGIGHIVSNEEIINFLFNKNKKPKLLLTLGYTKVQLDDVRVVSVPSSGKTGVALINELHNDFNLTIINANIQSLNLTIPNNIKIINVSTPNEYEKAVMEQIIDADIFVSNAAVSDFIFDKHDGKIKKDAKFDLTYKIGSDVLFEVSKKFPEKIKVGFALESKTNGKLIDLGMMKFEKKKLDLLVVNSKESLNSNTSSGVFIFKNDKIIQIQEFESLSKSDLANKISKYLKTILKDKKCEQ